MFRNLFVVALLLGLFATAEASAATATRRPTRKIAPGNHRPIYRRYGHHGLFHNGFLGIHSKRQTKISGAKVGSKRRGTL
ncbi:hypothetical protein MUN81_16790 [Hymenobacter sp. 5317J-9]|uniref:hypothetical protein n=1 Tax=Hymenobacter sp. 5317J-9 TaxID=2932250 RepID=UPI001FD6C167|nr:hypothetical protein [Hymenobacter sp. 5317J-9]UOQ96891.1 hypothetical protein MUN81_16790 [Hymenobacter sp. 5317J-9]